VNCAFECERKCASRKDETRVYDTFARLLLRTRVNKTSALLKCRVKFAFSFFFFFVFVRSVFLLFSLFFPLGEIPPAVRQNEDQENHPDLENLG